MEYRCCKFCKTNPIFEIEINGLAQRIEILSAALGASPSDRPQPRANSRPGSVPNRSWGNFYKLPADINGPNAVLSPPGLDRLDWACPAARPYRSDEPMLIGGRPIGSLRWCTGLDRSPSLWSYASARFTNRILVNGSARSAICLISLARSAMNSFMQPLRIGK